MHTTRYMKGRRGQGLWGRRSQSALATAQSADRRVPPRGGLRPVAFTKTHVNRALHPHQRSSDVLHVTPVPGVPMTSGRTPGSAAHPSQATLQVDMSTAHATVRHTKAARHALSVPLPAAPAATCGSAASGLMSGSVQQPHHDEERRCMHLRHMTRAHKIIHHRMHGM